MDEIEVSRRELLPMLLLPISGCTLLSDNSEKEEVQLGDIRIVNLTEERFKVNIEVLRNNNVVIDDSYVAQPLDGPSARILIEPTWDNSPAIYEINAQLNGNGAGTRIRVPSEATENDWGPCIWVSGEIQKPSDGEPYIGLSVAPPPGDYIEEYCTEKSP